jgi:hypothetical protein
MSSALDSPKKNSGLPPPEFEAFNAALAKVHHLNKHTDTSSRARLERRVSAALSQLSKHGQRTRSLCRPYSGGDGGVLERTARGASRESKKHKGPLLERAFAIE